MSFIGIMPLAFVSDLYKDIDNDYATFLAEKAEHVKESFISVFLNEHGCIYTIMCAGLHVDWSVRPNMIIAAALDYSPLEKNQKKSIVDITTKELLTPKGVKIFEPKKSTGYDPRLLKVLKQNVFTDIIRELLGLG